MKISQQEQIRRVLVHGPAFPDQVAEATGFPMRTCSAVLDKLHKAGKVLRSEMRVKRPHTNSAYLYSLRYREHRWWTTHDDKTLRELVDVGAPAKQIARVMGRSVHSIRFYAKRVGLTLPTREMTLWPPDVKMRAVEMRMAGKTWAAISAELGVPLGTVQHWAPQLRWRTTPATLAASPAKVD